MLLKITLKSDLCAAVGKHYAAMIDLDTALDEYGVPFIPSRRLKGCLKEIAEMCSTDDDIKRIFGESGAGISCKDNVKKSGNLHISDARIENYNSVINEIKSKKISAEKITELFCSVRGETAIENNTAKEESLRYIRVVNRISPITKEPLEFFAEIDFAENDKEIIKKYVKVLRNIGYHRNRGLGAVECECVPDDKISAEKITPDKESLKNCTALRLTVKLDGDLMLPDSDANHSDDYISGTMLLGAIAAKYNRKNENTDDFNSLFLSDVCFGNLYPAVVSYDGDKPEYSYTIPAPRYFAKIKAANENEDRIHNIIGKLKDKKQYKPLKKGYISKKYGHIKPETKIVYHNGNINAEEKGLYMQYCLSSGQYFSGTITGTPEKIKQIAELFYDGENFNDMLRFGRSKTAQYSLCRICEFKAEDEAQSEKPSDLKECIAAYRLESDVLLTDENGSFTTDIEALCRELKIDAKNLRPESSISAKTVSGYNSKWNMKKPQLSVITAGSVLVFDIKEKDFELKEHMTIGKKQNEGYGKVKLVYNADKETVDSQKPDELKPNESNLLSDLIKKNSKLDKITKLAIDNTEKIDFNPAQIGRIILMAKDADRAAENKFIDFEKRIYSIKTESISEKSISSFGEAKLEKLLADFGIQFTDCEVKCGKDNEKTITKTVSDKDWEYAYKYILTALTVKKYQLRKENGGND